MTSDNDQELPAELSEAGSIVNEAIGYMMGKKLPPVLIASALLGGSIQVLAETLGDEAICGILNNAIAGVRSGQVKRRKDAG